MTLRRRGVLGECDARTQGALVAGGYGRNRGRRSAPPRAARRYRASFWFEFLRASLIESRSVSDAAHSRTRGSSSAARLRCPSASSRRPASASQQAEVEEDVRVVRMLHVGPPQHGRGRVEVLRFVERQRLEPRLPGRWLERLPRRPADDDTVVSGSAAVAARLVAGSWTKIKVPAGASSSSPATVKRARPERTSRAPRGDRPPHRARRALRSPARPPRGPIGVDAEGGDAERDPDWDRVELATEAVEVVEVRCPVGGRGHAGTATASRTSRPNARPPRRSPRAARRRTRGEATLRLRRRRSRAP